ncbi:hypothetical protein [Nesterenkonia muleiensis]|uniref:hypothetical protein n=1 Tax=Nesterenkonia muleiensis TaxID=2282648 RepID=UPI00138FC8E8|nr:hypothetical protein [Nesterenkonia muleiensis]
MDWDSQDNDPPGKASIVTAVRTFGGSHTGERLSREVQHGRMLRVRRGQYVSSAAWLLSPPWERFLIAAAATGIQHRHAIFCRETALALHGVPLLRSPQVVNLRTDNAGYSGYRSPGSMTGSAPCQTLHTLCAALSSAAGRKLVADRDFKSFGTRRHLTPLPLRNPGGRQNTSARASYLGALTRVLPPATDHFESQSAVVVEPLELAVLDTVCATEDFAAAVSILDAVKAGRCQDRRPRTLEDFAPWKTVIPSSRALRRWLVAWEFADARSGSVGESWSRVLMHQGGFAAPELQKHIRLPDGSTALLDFCWEAAGIAGEFDGDLKYRQAQRLSGQDPAGAVISEKKRQDQLVRLGYRPLRWFWNDLQNGPTFWRLLQKAGVPRTR